MSGEGRADGARGTTAKGLEVSKIEWPSLLRGAPIPAAAFRVAIVVWTYTGADGTGAFPGNRRIAQDADVSVSTAKRHLAALRDDGWLIRDEVGGMGTYRSGAAERLSSTYRLGPGPSSLTAHRGRTSDTRPTAAPPDVSGGGASDPSPGSTPHPQGAHQRAGGGFTSGPGVGSPVGHQQVMDQDIDQSMDQVMHQGMSATGSPTSFAPDDDEDDQRPVSLLGEVVTASDMTQAETVRLLQEQAGGYA